MGGLRALCCSKADQNDPESHSPPNRPVQKISEKETPNDQNGVTNATQEKPAERSAEKLVEKPVEKLEEAPKKKPARRNLWEEAHGKLDTSSRELLPADGTSPANAIQGVIDITTKRYKEWEKGGLRIHRREKTDINLRDMSEKVFEGAMKAQEIISTAVSFDPTGHDVQIVQNRLDRRDAIFQSAAFLAENLAWFAIVDANCRDRGVDSDKHVDDALLRAYTAVLEFTAEVRKSEKESEAGRTWESIFPLTDQELSTLKSEVKEQRAAANQWLQLSADLGNRKQAKEHLAKTEEALQATERVEAKVERYEEERQLEWLSKSSPSDHQNFLQSKITADTGVWLFDSPDSSVIEDIKEGCRVDPNSYVAYWYFQFNEAKTQSVYTMVRSLIRQLCRSPLPSSVVNMWEEHHRQRDQPKWETIRKVLDEVISSVPDEARVYLIFDALDECPGVINQERMTLLSLLMGLLERHKNKIRILATSRPEDDIKEKLGRVSNIDLEERLGEDVKIFVHTELKRRPRLSRLGDVHDKILNALLSFKERRFRWAELQIGVLETKHGSDDVLKALKSVPQTLEETYRKILDNIPSSDWSLVRDILMIICLSPVPFDIQSVAHMEYLVVKEKTSEHHKVQFTSIEAHKCLAEKTVKCLLSQTEALKEKEAMEKTLFVYSAKYWHFHLGFLTGTDFFHSKLQEKVDCLFSESTVYFNWVRVADSNDHHQRDSQWTKEPQDCEPPIHRASRMGLIKTVETLFIQGSDPLASYTDDWDWVTNRSQSSFNAAAKSGQLEVLQFLLSKHIHLPYNVIASLLEEIDHVPAGKEKLAEVLRMLWDQGLLGGKIESSDKSGTVKSYIIDMSMTNRKSSVEMMDVFLSWRPEVAVPITENMLWNAFNNHWGPPEDMVRLLFEKGDVHIPPEFFGNRGVPSETGGIAFLAAEHPIELPRTDEVICCLAAGCNTKTMDSLLKSWKNDIAVTEDVLFFAASNQEDPNMLRFLWARREPDTKITQSMLPDVASDNLELINFILEELGPDAELSEEIVQECITYAEDGVAMLALFLGHSPGAAFVSEEFIYVICKSRTDAVPMLKLLRDNGYLNMPITADLLYHAASNYEAASSVFNYLVGMHRGPQPITEKVLLAVVRNRQDGARMLETILPGLPDTLLTDAVFEGACESKATLGDSRDALEILLERKHNDLPIQSMLNNIRDSFRQENVLRLMLERDLFVVDETVVENFATNFACLEVLLAWNPDVPITHKTLERASRSAAGMRAILSGRGNDLDIPEDIVVTAATQYEGKEVLEVIRNRKGSGFITEVVIQKILKNPDDRPNDEALNWLLRQQPGPIMTKIWKDTWQNVDINKGDRAMVFFGYLEKTGSKITDEMLLDHPYDADKEENYGFDDIIKALSMVDFLPNLPDTERTMEIVLERCSDETIQAFLESKPKIQITDNMLRAAGKNVIADKDELSSLLQERKG
ncbi:hypothetical protein F1880_010271 [Penicillium rolfsii]|nr:hypothetical protein F1880_010271 [Penicillium rolfsii]